MPRRLRAQDLDFEIHVDRSCLSETIDDADMDKDNTQAEPEVRLGDDELEQLKKEIDNTINDMNESKDVDDVETSKVEIDTPLAEPIDLDDAHHGSDGESEGTDSRRESLESGPYDPHRHRRTSERTEALIQAAARDIVTQIEANRGRESMNTMSETDESFISHSEGSGRPSDAHSLGRESYGESEHDESLRDVEDSYVPLSRPVSGRQSIQSERHSIGSQSAHSQDAGSHRASLESHGSVHSQDDSRVSIGDHESAHSHQDSHRSSLESHHDSIHGCQDSHRSSLDSHHDSVHSHQNDDHRASIESHELTHDQDAHRESLDSHHESVHSHQDDHRASLQSHDSGSRRLSVGSHASIHSHGDSGSFRASLDHESIHGGSHRDSIDESVHSASHRESIEESVHIHRQSVDGSVHSHRESIGHESVNSHRGSSRGSVNSHISRAGSTRQSDGHRSVGSHHSTEDDHASRHGNDDDVFSDHSPRSSMGSLSDSDQKKLDKIMSMPRSSLVSDMSQYDKEEEFVPTIRGAPRPAFRSPSSVKALQMSSPPSSVYGSPRSGRRGMPTVSRLGSPSISAQYSPKKTPPRFRRATPPLVLLHVTLLPLRWGWGDLLERATSSSLSDDAKVVRDSWLQLQDRMGDTTVERGILLPHPQNDYEVLEERLLEALELPVKFRARILSCGHYLGPSNDGLDDSDSEDEYEDDRRSRRTLDMSHWCKTCGRNIRCEARGPPNKVFRVKVYASNGLMKAGAWEACWKEMERVDVEIEPLVEPTVQDEMNRLEADQERELEERERELEMQDEYDYDQLSEPEYEDLHDETLQHEEVDPTPERSLHESFHGSVNESIHGSVHGSVHESVHGSVHGSVHESVHDSVHEPAHDSVHDSIHGSIHDSLHESLHEPTREQSERVEPIEEINVSKARNIDRDIPEHPEENLHQDLEEERSEQDAREASFMEHSRVPTPEPHIETPEEKQQRDDERFREIYGHPPDQTHAYDQRPAEPYAREAPDHSPPREAPRDAPRDLKNATLSDLLLESARVLMQDKKNVVIILLGLLTLILALRGGQQADPRPFQTVVVSPEASTITVTHVPAQETPRMPEIRVEPPRMDVEPQTRALEHQDAPRARAEAPKARQPETPRARRAEPPRAKRAEAPRARRPEPPRANPNEIEAPKAVEKEVEAPKAIENQVEAPKLAKREVPRPADNGIEAPRAPLENGVELAGESTEGYESYQTYDDYESYQTYDSYESYESQTEPEVLMIEDMAFVAGPAEIESQSKPEITVVEEPEESQTETLQETETERQVWESQGTELEIFEPAESSIESAVSSEASTNSASTDSVDPCAGCTLSRESQAYSQLDEPSRAEIPQTATVFSERIVRVVETVTEVATATVKVTETILQTAEAVVQDVADAEEQVKEEKAEDTNVEAGFVACSII